MNNLGRILAQPSKEKIFCFLYDFKTFHIVWFRDALKKGLSFNNPTSYSSNNFFLLWESLKFVYWEPVPANLHPMKSAVA